VTGYAIAHLQDVTMGPDIVEYLQRIDATLAPFGGRFIVHGGTPVELEGGAPGTPIVIEFPSVDRARAWYDSPAYRQILPLRTRNARSVTYLVGGVDAEHRATDVLAG
jgi:uncharacterized protein (DUF1330 family)